MRRGKLGISFTAYAVITFVLALFLQMPLCLLLLGFVLYVERDEWTNRQCIQAFILSFASGIMAVLTFLLMGTFFGTYGYGGYVAYRVIGLIALALWIVLIVFCIRALVRVTKGEEADIPLFSDWAYRAFGYVRHHQQAPPPQQQPYPQPYPPGYGAPMPPREQTPPPNGQPQPTPYTYPPHPAQQAGPGGYPSAVQGQPPAPPVQGQPATPPAQGRSSLGVPPTPPQAPPPVVQPIPPVAPSSTTAGQGKLGEEPAKPPQGPEAGTKEEQ